MREIVDEAALATKTVRRQHERRLRLIAGGRTNTAQSDPPAATQILAHQADEQNTFQPWERMLLV
jgi:hypothetical protein